MAGEELELRGSVMGRQVEILQTVARSQGERTLWLTGRHLQSHRFPDSQTYTSAPRSIITIVVNHTLLYLINLSVVINSAELQVISALPHARYDHSVPNRSHTNESILEAGEVEVQLSMVNMP
jgi:hypothetical protein